MASIVGTSNRDTLNGTTGADTITGGLGYDQMTGGAGADVFAFNYGDGGGFPHDAITDFQVGTDRLQLPAGAALHTEDDTAGQWVHYGADRGNNDWVQLRGVHGATLAQLTGSGGTTPTPPPPPPPPPPPSGPTTGNDTIAGTANADTINALAGNDSVSGGDGADTITGGLGYDQMTGGAGADVFAFNYGDGGGFPHDAITDFQVGTDRLQLPAGAALHTEDDTAGQWVHYGADRGNNDWVQLRGVHGATLAQLTGSGGTTPTPPPPPSGPSAGEFGPQVWGDEFNGTSLDRSNWPSVFGGDNLYYNGAFRWDSRMVSVGNGNLNIGLEKQPDGIWETSGLLAVPQPSWGAPGFPFTHGKVEIRAKASQEVDGAGPCFLLWPASNDHWPPEVDILETPHGRGMFTNHWAGPNGEDTYESTQFDLDYSQWHVYGLEWTPNRLTMTVDGQVMKTYTGHIPSEPMAVGLQGHVGGPNDGWYGNANATGVNRVDISVDYVRVFDYLG